MRVLFGMICRESNTFLLQRMASSSICCFLSFPWNLLLSLIIRAEKQTFYTSILNQLYESLNQLKWKVSVTCTYPFFTTTSGIKKIGYKNSHFSVDTSLMYINPPWCVFGFPEWLWDSVDLLTWLEQSF